jgi:hypothetical protein
MSPGFVSYLPAMTFLELAATAAGAGIIAAGYPRRIRPAMIMKRAFKA